MKEGERKERDDICVQMPSNQTHLTTQTLSLSLSLIKRCCQKYPSATPQKIPSSSLSFKRRLFFTELCGLFWVFVCCLGQSFTEKTGKQETSPPFPYSLSVSLLLFSSLPFMFLSTLFSIIFPLQLSLFLSFHTTHPLVSLFNFSTPPIILGFLALWVVTSLCDLMKKMKGVLAVEPSSYAGYEDSMTRFKHQSLMQDYEELHKDARAMKKKLQMIKQKKSTLLAEVRFLRRRYKYLMGNQSMNPQTKQDVVQSMNPRPRQEVVQSMNPRPRQDFVRSMDPRPKQDVAQTHNFETQRTSIMKGKSYSKKKSDSRHLPALDLNQKERINHKMEGSLQKCAPKFDLNHKARALSGKEATLQNPIPHFDLNHKERIQSGKESTKQKNTPVFDLNQISTEEEELQANCEPLRTEEPNKSLLRGESDELHNDMKLLVCRTIGNGSNRSGKRKITWQDQVALRV